MNEDKLDAKSVKKSRKRVITVLVAAAVLLVALALIIAILENVINSAPEVETYGPVSPDLLAETKDEDFNIMEYEEYLSFNRTVMLKDSGVTVSIDDKNLQNYDAALRLVYQLICHVIAGEYDEYNSLVDKKLQKESFTQQQIYDVVFTRYSYNDKSDKIGSYSEYVYKVEYKIHENNGTFRNDIVSDASRPQYFVVNNSKGYYLLMDVIESGYLK